MPNNPDVVSVDLHRTNIVTNPPPLPVVANKSILAFLKSSFTPINDWVWDEEGDTYSLVDNDESLITISQRQFKNSKLATNDVDRYKKIIAKRMRQTRGSQGV